MYHHMVILIKKFINDHMAGSEVLGEILMFAATITVHRRGNKDGLIEG